MKIINIIAPTVTTEKLDTYRESLTTALKNYYDLDQTRSIVLNLIEPMSYRAAAVIQSWAKQNEVFYRTIGLHSSQIHEADLFMIVYDEKAKESLPKSLQGKIRIKPTIVIRVGYKNV